MTTYVRSSLLLTSCRFTYVCVCVYSLNIAKWRSLIFVFIIIVKGARERSPRLPKITRPSFP